MGPPYSSIHKVGSQMHISRDTFGHGVPLGTLVELLRYDPKDNTWKVQEPEIPGPFWVGDSDLEPIESEEELDAEALRLFGLVRNQQQHCPTCTCNKNC